MCSWRFLKIHRKTPVSEPLFNKVAGLGPATLLKKRLWHSRFPVDFCERTPFLQNIYGRLPLERTFSHSNEKACNEEEIFELTFSTGSHAISILSFPVVSGQTCFQLTVLRWLNIWLFWSVTKAFCHFFFIGITYAYKVFGLCTWLRESKPHCIHDLVSLIVLRFVSFAIFTIWMLIVHSESRKVH